ncbi:HECT-domain-containing protein [Sodiomyces alkalinus F11]|uniref:HECT-type E3 ubiquitin transferase n=1 Tax=Sodiomyces alkalinus (strain CBS 110278 / VKM F-3762 / F11) TaxID=1314773 RepID=A0A3N2PKC2_SODAK|nr:HECT-domain-containing protein [Sodiomyces alkalinus F11]ROT34844.1 HECT-domain-containing protein [Sodiomyces alkalinus F11]
MYPTFTGNSRRTRNVNLSGQRQNPFAAAWSPSTGSGASLTISNAQAERQHRQQERQRAKAAKTIQRTWRSHKTRRQLRNGWRQDFDHIYSVPDNANPQQRAFVAFPLLLAFFEPKLPGDLQRMLRFARDFASADLQPFLPPQVCSFRVERLSEILIHGLDICSHQSKSRDDVEILLTQLTRVASFAPHCLSQFLQPYYKTLARFMVTATYLDEVLLGPTVECVVAPLGAPGAPETHDSFITDVYEALAFNLLTANHLPLLEKHISVFSRRISVVRLASAITAAYTSGYASTRSPEDLLWLLAHFIDLHKTQPGATGPSVYLRALYVQLSTLTSQISIRLPLLDQGSRDDNRKGDDVPLPLPPYVAKHITSLVDRAGIAALLTDITANFASRTTTEDFEGASLLAGYVLTLLQCFPRQGDDIRMRLFLGDIPSTHGDVPVLKFLWNTMCKTQVYQEILRESVSVISVVQAHLSSSLASPEISAAEQEWRLIHLFLELYTFILRISDDDDFFSSIGPNIAGNNQSPPSRLRSCGLALAEVKSLTSFLKNLAFTLHYHASDIVPNTSSSESVPDSDSMSKLDAYFGSITGIRPVKEKRKSGLSGSMAKPDARSLRSIVTVALRLLYERDSRRPFLPPNHWLMTAKFDMEGFVTAVVAEQERQQAEISQDTDEEDDDNDEEMDDALPISHTVAGQRSSRHAQIERLRAQQRRAQRDRMLSLIGPKLEILRHMPFVIPFETRVQIFRQFVHLDKHKRRGGLDADQWRMTMINNPLFPGRDPARKHQGKIRRESEFDDAYEQFYQLGDGLKEPLQIQFVDTFGNIEEGIDGGGVTKEFLISAINSAFPDRSKPGGNDEYFAENAQHLVYPNPVAVDAYKFMMRTAKVPEDEQREHVRELLQRFEFLGRLVGKCMYEGILIDEPFAPFFLLKWASGQTGENSYRGNINDLKDLDQELYQGLLHLKNYPGDLAELDLNFTIEDELSTNGPIRTITRELMPNGKSTPVTNENRLLYIAYTARHRLVVQPAQQTSAFLRGLRSIIAPSWLSMFNQNELQHLVGGDSSEIDVDDLRRNTIYSGLYSVGDDGLEHPTIELFWKVVRGFSDAKRRLLLSYVTSTPRAPLLGFSQLNPRFSIRDAGHEQGRLPSTSTCVNLLKLPIYDDEETLRDRLERAITSQAGFGLS